MADGIEPEYAAPYAAWKAKQSPETLNALVTAAMPAITKTTSRYSQNDPLALSRARSIAIDALPRYDHRQGKLNAFLETSLRGLTRQTARAAAGVKVPDRVAAERIYLDNAEKELTHELGRSPSTAELIEHSKLPLSRITRIRQYRPAVPFSALSSDVGDSFGGAVRHPGQVTTNPMWTEAVYHDQSPMDQRIMEMSMGLFGNQVHSNERIAAKLGVTPGAISQRKAKIQSRLDEGLGLFSRALGG